LFFIRAGADCLCDLLSFVQLFGSKEKEAGGKGAEEDNIMDDILKINNFIIHKKKHNVVAFVCKTLVSIITSLVYVGNKPC
jgi:hypothetical protein